MEKLLIKARNRMAKNSRKGFTLVELIVVIVILAILIAALVPAILGVINQANVVADQSDVRSVMMAGSVVGMQQTPPRFPGTEKTAAEAIVKEFTGGVNVVEGTYTIFFDGAVAVGAYLPPAGARSNTHIFVGAVDFSEDMVSGTARYDAIAVIIKDGAGDVGQVAYPPKP